VKLRIIISSIALFVVAGIILVAVLYGPGLFAPELSATQQPTQSTQPRTNKAIMLENAQQGTTSWEIPKTSAATKEIQAYSGSTSVAPGQKISFYVSTLVEGTSYALNIYRLGWYGGLGGRLLFSAQNMTGHAQGYYSTATHQLVNCHSCLVTQDTHMIAANWQLSYTLVIPANWTTGVYLAKFTDAQGMQTYAPFDVRAVNYDSVYVAITDDTTSEAYNLWGGYSLYGADTASAHGETLGPSKAVMVSFNRPYEDAYGASQILLFDLSAIHWLERQGYDVSYLSTVDLHADPAQLLHHKAVLVLGHSEYWSKEMRDGLEQARDKGVGLAFLGANDIYWQIRFAADNAGIPNRTVICYKVQTVLHNLANDPLYGKDNTRVTTEWRDPLLNLPENALIGIMYSEDNWDQPTNHFPAWTVSSGANSPLLNGTGLQPGQQYGCDLVGYEWDGVVGNGATPVGLQVLGTTPTYTTVYHVAGSSNTAYYIALSGAMVFATGSIYWTFALDNYRFNSDKLCSSQNLVVPGMQKLMEHVMDALIVPHSAGQMVYAKPPATSLASLTVIALSLIGMSARLYRKLKKEL
jgi:hypothetical protein